MNGLVFCYLESQLQNPGHNGQTWLGFPFLLLPSGWACNLKHHLLRSCSPALLLSCSPFSKHLVLASQPLKLSTAATSPLSPSEESVRSSSDRSSRSAHPLDLFTATFFSGSPFLLAATPLPPASCSTSFLTSSTSLRLLSPPAAMAASTASWIFSSTSPLALSYSGSAKLCLSLL